MSSFRRCWLSLLSTALKCTATQAPKLQLCSLDLARSYLHPGMSFRNHGLTCGISVRCLELTIGDQAIRPRVPIRGLPDGYRNRKKPLRSCDLRGFLFEAWR